MDYKRIRKIKKLERLQKLTEQNVMVKWDICSRHYKEVVKMHMTDFFKAVGPGEQIKGQNTVLDREENTAEKKQQETKEVTIEDNEAALDAFRSDLASSTYRAPEDLAQLVSTEEVTNVKDILAQLKDAELKIAKSNAADAVKELSKKRIRMVKNKCNVKINRLNLEQELELQAEQAKKAKDDTRASELEEQLRRTRSARKSEEYTDVQRAMQEEQLEQQLDKYSIYEQNAYGTAYTRNMYKDMSTSGSFINASVGNFKATM